MKQIDSLKLVTFLSIIFEPFRKLTVDQCNCIAQNLFGNDLGSELFSELIVCSDNFYCSGKKYLTPRNVAKAIDSSINRWNKKCFFVLNTNFNVHKDDVEFYKELEQIISNHPFLLSYFPLSVEKIDKKFFSEKNLIQTRAETDNLWNLCLSIKHHRPNLSSKIDHFEKFYAGFSDSNAFCNSLSKISNKQFLISFLWHFSFQRKNRDFYLDALNKCTNITSARCVLAIYFANNVFFNLNNEQGQEKLALDIVDLILKRKDTLILLGEIIDILLKFGNQYKHTLAINKLITNFINKYLLESKLNKRSLQPLFKTIYKLNSLKDFSFFSQISFDDKEIETKFFSEFLEFILPFVIPKNLESINCSTGTLNILISAFYYGFHIRKLTPYRFTKLNNSFEAFFKIARLEGSFPNSNNAMLNLLTLELVTYDELINFGHPISAVQIERIWTVFESWLPVWDCFVFNSENNFLPQLTSIFSCTNYANLVERTLFKLNNRPFPSINLIAVIFSCHPEFRKKYSYFMLDYVSRYESQWSIGQSEHISRILCFSGFTKKELEKYGIEHYCGN